PLVVHDLAAGDAHGVQPDVRSCARGHLLRAPVPVTRAGRDALVGQHVEPRAPQLECPHNDVAAREQRAITDAPGLNAVEGEADAVSADLLTTDPFLVAHRRPSTSEGQ